jgi:integrase/recombinase XerD
MRDLRKGIHDYLMLRRGLGFKLVKHEAALEEFAAFLKRKRSAHITSELALEWATLPAHHQPCQWTARLTIVRGFARYWMSIAAKNGAILAGEKEPWCGLRDGLLQG